VKIKEFTDIKLSLKALKQAIQNQINHSEKNYEKASDIQISIDFINNLKETIILMERLFGETLNNTIMLIVIEGGKINEN